MPEAAAPDLEGPLSLIPSARYVMTACFDGDRAGILVEWVQRCASEPPLVAVAVRKGRPIEPIIRDSHAFALCAIAPDDTFLLRKLGDGDKHSSDVLDAIRCETLRTGSPCLTRALAAIDCEVVRHFDLDADHELYVGQVVAAKSYAGASADSAAQR